MTVKKTVTRRGSPTGKGATQGQQLRAKGPTPAVGNPYARPRLTWGSSSGVGRRSGRTKQVVKVSGRSGTRSQTRIREDQVQVPNYAPLYDRHGRRVWDGSRNSLSFNAQTYAKMRPAQGEPECALTLAGCTKIGEALDHREDFATKQSELPRVEICDGRFHFEAVLKVKASELYNSTGNLQWACTSCNSRKSGAKGIDANVPVYKGQCPGALCRL